ncbi:MAG: pyridoxal-phosphate-dependent aminotransferase family protein [Vicinamibacterales bacterium]
MNVPERLLLGPGPSPVSSRVMQAMGSPVVSHLDPAMNVLLDEVRQRLASTFGAGDGALSLAISGTGTAGMEAAVANVARPGARAVVVVTGYFGDRLAQMLERYAVAVTRVQVEWGRACDPAQVERALSEPADIVAMVHGETSTGVVNPVHEIAAIAHARGALTIVDAVTTLGGVPLKTGASAIDVCYSCTQKGLGAPSGLAPITFSRRALEKRAPSRSFYVDLALLEDFWLRRKYHHTISAPLVYALHEALAVVEEEGLETRWERHRRHHEALVAGLDALGLSLLPPASERLWTLNAVRVPEGVDEAAVRRRLLDEFGIEIGAGLGPVAGKIWRVGLMGAGSTLGNILLFLSAFERVLRAGGHRLGSESAALAAAERVAAAV